MARSLNQFKDWMKTEAAYMTEAYMTEDEAASAPCRCILELLPGERRSSCTEPELDTFHLESRRAIRAGHAPINRTAHHLYSCPNLDNLRSRNPADDAKEANWNERWVKKLYTV